MKDDFIFGRLDNELKEIKRRKERIKSEKNSWDRAVVIIREYVSPAAFVIIYLTVAWYGGPWVNLFMLCILLVLTEKKEKRVPKFAIYLRTDSFTIKTFDTMQVTLKPQQGQDFQIQPLDRKGNPAQVEAGTVSYSSSNEAVVTVEENADDETKFKIKTNGVGTGQVNFSADADLGEGVETISGFIDVTVTAEKAVTIEAKPTSEPYDL